MTYVQTETATQSKLVLRVLMHLRGGRINHSTACFADNALTSFHRQCVATCREDQGNEEISLRWQDS
jgi:hypothetical protein